MIAGTLTTTGLGDVVPLSRVGKAFISAYALVGCVVFSRIIGQLAVLPLEVRALWAEPIRRPARQPATAAALPRCHALPPLHPPPPQHCPACVCLPPPQLARRKAQRQVFERYGDTLDEDTLATLAHGPLVKALRLSADDSNISRDEFTLLLLLEQGKIGEADLQECRERFQALDVDDNGILDRRDIELLRASGSLWPPSTQRP
eukprot:5706034-Prymnesium_polylepis.1